MVVTLLTLKIVSELATLGNRTRGYKTQGHGTIQSVHEKAISGQKPYTNVTCECAREMLLHAGRFCENLIANGDKGENHDDYKEFQVGCLAFSDSLLCSLFKFMCHSGESFGLLRFGVYTPG